MKIIFIVVFVSVAGNDDFFNNFEEIPPPPLGDLGPLPKCGENDQVNKYQCVPYFNCDPHTNTIIENPEVDGSNTIIPRSPIDPKCGHYLQVCCRSPNGTISSNEFVPTVPLEFQPKCGISNRNNDNLTISQNSAKFGEFPWMVAIFQNNSIICGGSLVTPVAVLTAAHCVQDFKADEIKIRAGEWGLQSENEEIPHQERNVSKIIIHEHYMRKTLYNDVALLILEKSVSKANNTGTICLPSTNPNFDLNDCLVTGWGTLSSSHPNKNGTVMKTSTVSLIPNKECQKTLRNTSLGNEFILDPSFICATEKSGDVCIGDGGGPLVCSSSDNPNRYFQIGIVSWGVVCGQSNIPGVYANATQFRDWIDEKLGFLGYNFEPYIIRKIQNNQRKGQRV